jgi:ABC-type glycerol-3-phosphate transport system substrate-binding protein
MAGAAAEEADAVAGSQALSRRGVLAGAISGGSGLAALVALAACGAPAPAETKVDLAKINRKLLVWSDRGPARLAQVERWSQLHPNLAAEVSDIGSGGQGSEAITKFLAAVAAGDVADVVRFDRFQIGSYTHRGAFTALDAYQKTDKLDLKRFVESAAAEAHGLDKKLYGLPNSTDNRPFFWNKMHFREIGVDPEKPPATWDQLKEYALKLNRSSGAGITRLGWTYRTGLSGSSLTYLWGFLNGGEFLSADAKKAQLNHPKVVEAMQWVFELLEAQGGTQRHEEFQRTFGSNENHALFAQQQSMTIATQGLLGTIARWRPDFDFGIGPNPVRRAGDPGATWSGGFAWVIAKGVRNPEVSWEMIKDLVTQESILHGYEADATQGRAQGQTYLPGMSAQPAVDRAALERFKTGIPAVDRGMLWAIDYMKVSKFRPISPAAIEMYDGANTAWNEVLAKRKTVKQAYDDVTATAQAALNQAYAVVGK